MRRNTCSDGAAQDWRCFSEEEHPSAARGSSVVKGVFKECRSGDLAWHVSFIAVHGMEVVVGKGGRASCGWWVRGGIEGG